MADTLILYTNKPNSFQFTITAEGIVLSEATVRLCIQATNDMIVVFKCTPKIDNNFTCDINDTKIISNGQHKCWLEVVTMNGLIFKPFVGDLDVKEDTSNKSATVSAEIKPAKSSEVKKDTSVDKKPEVKKEEKPSDTSVKKDEDKKEDTKQEKTDEKLHTILQGLGLTEKRSIAERHEAKKKIPSLKSKLS